MAANVNVTQRMLGARSIVATAVGSRPKLNTVRTSAVNTTAESRAVRVRNSRTRSLRATVHAWPSSSRIGHRPPVRRGDLGGAPLPAPCQMHEPPLPLKRHVRGELDTLVHVVRREHQHAAGAAQLRQQVAELGRSGEIEPGERLVQERYPRNGP